MPVLSVIVPVYNVEKYLRRCLDSICKQSFRDFEAILIDDGSTDYSGVICDEYVNLDKRFHVVHQKNVGLLRARMNGVLLSKGKYVTFVDSDDWIDSNMYEVLMASLLSDSNIDICLSSCVREDVAGNVHSVLRCTREQDFSPEEALGHLLRTQFFAGSLCDKIYKKILFDGLSVPNITYGEDVGTNWLLFHRVSGKIHYCPLFAYHYCENPSSLTHRKISLQWFEIYDFLIEQVNHESSATLRKVVYERLARSSKSILYQMFMEGASKKDIEYIQKRLHPHIDKVVTEEFDKILYLPYGEIEEFIIEVENRLKASLEEANQRYRDIYIYGAGKIAREITDFMGKLGINYKGFIVSGGSGKSFGKHIICVDTIRKRIEFANDTGVVFALNRLNYEQVKNTLSPAFLEHSINVGQYNRNY